MKNLPIKFDKVLLPKKDIDLNKWAVVACDQYTSQPEYWRDLEKFVGENPSTYNLIYPEVYLESDTEEDAKKRIDKIISNMQDYMDKDLFYTVDNGLILVKRTSPSGAVRWGITMLVDLNEYSFDPNDKTLIRATEGTVLERLPPRIEVRKNCLLELPHVLVLIDDPKRTVIEPFIRHAKAGKLEKLYDSNLNMNGGHVEGFHIANQGKIENALKKLLKNSIKKYGEEFLFAVGDGNHSLATAKACMDKDNPLSQYALVEIENIYDEGIVFEPIHRLVFPKNRDEFIRGLEKIADSESETVEAKLLVGDKTQSFKLPANAIVGYEKVQKYIDEFLETDGGKVDYIHGEQDLQEICKAEDGIGIVLNSMDKGTLFDFVVQKGTLPRKTFSMGEANEKRYYIEARKIK